jgi:hypothetical protein
LPAIHLTRGYNQNIKGAQKTKLPAGHQWLMPVILAFQEAAIRRIVAQSQTGQRVYKTLSRKNTLHKKGCGVAQGEGPEFKTQYKKNPLNSPKSMTQ